MVGAAKTGETTVDADRSAPHYRTLVLLAGISIAAALLAGRSSTPGALALAVGANMVTQLLVAFDAGKLRGLLASLKGRLPSTWPKWLGTLLDWLLRLESKRLRPFFALSIAVGLLLATVIAFLVGRYMADGSFELEMSNPPAQSSSTTESDPGSASVSAAEQIATTAGDGMVSSDDLAITPDSSSPNTTGPRPAPTQSGGSTGSGIGGGTSTSRTPTSGGPASTSTPTVLTSTTRDSSSLRTTLDTTPPTTPTTATTRTTESTTTPSTTTTTTTTATTSTTVPVGPPEVELVSTTWSADGCSPTPCTNGIATFRYRNADRVVLIGQTLGGGGPINTEDRATVVDSAWRTATVAMPHVSGESTCVLAEAMRDGESSGPFFDCSYTAS